MEGRMKLMVVSDIRLYREGLAEVLERDGQLRVEGLAACGTTALARVEEADIDAVLVDVAMPRFLEIIRAIRELEPGMKLIALGLSENEADFLPCAQAGISGYLEPDGSVDDLITSLKSAADEELRCSYRLAGALLRQVARLSRPLPQVAGPGGLTARQLEILELIDEGLSNKEIARRLFIEVATVKNHVHNILERMQVRTRGEAAARFRRHTGPTARRIHQPGMSTSQRTL